jgi:hypothetical protein
LCTRVCENEKSSTAKTGAAAEAEKKTGFDRRKTPPIFRGIYWGPASMTWIKTVRMEEDDNVKKAIEEERKFYPAEYAMPVPAVFAGVEQSIVGSHSLFPDVLFHAFSTFGALMSPELPLKRHQHEMIATMVSVTNRCHY